MKNIKKIKVYEDHKIELAAGFTVSKLIESLRPYQDSDWSVSFGYYEDSYVDHFFVFRYREETDEENRLRAKERELKKYERLKKKLGE